MSLMRERILQVHENDELVREFFNGRIRLVRWFDANRFVWANRYTLFVNDEAECIGAFSAHEAVRHARYNRAFLRHRDGTK